MCAGVYELCKNLVAIFILTNQPHRSSDRPPSRLLYALHRPLHISLHQFNRRINGHPRSRQVIRQDRILGTVNWSHGYWVHSAMCIPG